MPFVTLTLEIPDVPIASVRTRLNLAEKEKAVRAHLSMLNGVLGRVDKHRGMVRSIVSSACAIGTVTCTVSAAVDNTDTCTIGGTALAVVAAPSTTAQFAKGSTDAGFATNLANCINANATLAKIVRATVASNVVTITALAPGPIGNLITLAEAGNGMAISGAAFTLGSSDAPNAYQLGYAPSV